MLYRQVTKEEKRNASDDPDLMLEMGFDVLWVVPVEPCEHGKIDPHKYLINSTNGQMQVFGDCEGAALKEGT